MHKATASPPIYTLRRQRVVLDTDLARLYGVPTSRLNEAIKRSASRFPADFRFQLSHEEVANLRSQIAISRLNPTVNQEDTDNSSQSAMSPRKHGGRSYLPWAFTEHGALMAATVLNSPRAVQMSLFLVRAFVRMRDELATSTAIMKRLAAIDQRPVTHDVVLRDIYEKLRPLLAPPPAPARKEIGFHTLLRKTRRARRT